jgi:hypothetical protein
VLAAALPIVRDGRISPPFPVNFTYIEIPCRRKPIAGLRQDRESMAGLAIQTSAT